jgi:hypothetical protein
MSPTPSLPALRIVWGSLLAAIGFYVVILASGMLHVPGPPQGPSLVSSMAAVAVVVAAMSELLPRILYRQAVSKIEVEIAVEPVTEASSIDYRQATPVRKVFADAEAARRAAIICFQAPFIISVALSESVALIGLALGVMGYGMGTAAPFFAVGFLLVTLRFPTEQQVIAPFEKFFGTTMTKSPQ